MDKEYPELLTKLNDICKKYQKDDVENFNDFLDNINDEELEPVVPWVKYLYSQVPSGKDKFLKIKEKNIVDDQMLKDNSNLKKLLYPIYLIDNENPKDYGKVDAKELQKDLLIGKDLSKLKDLRK